MIFYDVIGIHKRNDIPTLLGIRVTTGRTVKIAKLNDKKYKIYRCEHPGGIEIMKQMNVK